MKNKIPEFLEDAIRIMLVIIFPIAGSLAAIVWQLLDNDDMRYHIGINVILLALGSMIGMYHFFSAMHALVVIFSYERIK